MVRFMSFLVDVAFVVVDNVFTVFNVVGVLYSLAFYVFFVLL